jgi:tRNA(Ile)-lysidine synthase
MRDAGSTTPSPRDWTASPSWPEGRSVFLLRPLIGSRRADLRAWLAEQGETWIEDPANDDPRYARTRVRRGLAAGAIDPPCALSKPVALARSFSEGLAGELRVAADDILGADPVAARMALSAGLLSASGGRRPPRREAVERLRARLAEGRGGVLAGARASVDNGFLVIGREAGEFRRGGAPAVTLKPQAPAVWDGRFEVASERPAEARPLGGLIGRLPRAQAAQLKTVPAAFRAALPAVVFEDGAVTCPILAGAAGTTARALVLERFSAACGLIESEASIWRVAKAASAS